jgi:uncharacterized cysteine cluster protein YcgN (CxxCxxCC family)
LGIEEDPDEDGVYNISVATGLLDEKTGACQVYSKYYSIE